MSGYSSQMSGQNGKMSGQSVQMSGQFSEMSGQLSEMSGQKNDLEEKRKESSPLNPLKEKIKEESANKSACINFVGESESEEENDPVLFSQEELPTSKPQTESKKELSPAEKRDKAITNRKKREKEFYDSLVPYVEVYGKEMIREFYNYWTEPNKSGTQMRFELQPTWCLSRRLCTWAKNNDKYERVSTSTSQSTTNGDNKSRGGYSGISELIGKTIV